MTSFPLLLFSVFVCVVVHEYGHYLAMRLCGVGAREFSFGFGPSLFRMRARGTEWVVRLFPLGGFVAPKTGSDAEKDVPGKTIGDCATRTRVFILASGAAANFLLTLGLAYSVFLYSGIPDYENPRIGETLEKSAAGEAGILAEDEFVVVDGKRTKTWDEAMEALADFRMRMGTGGSGTLDATVRRGGAYIDFSIPLRDEPGAPLLGVRPTLGESSLWSAVAAVVERIPVVAGRMRSALRAAFSGSDENAFHGAVFAGIAAGNAGKAGVETFVFFLAAMSLGVGVVNLLPVPVLDGWGILVALAETVRRKPFSEKGKRAAAAVGLSLLLAAMVLAIANDLEVLLG